jgi:hypothetical protein
MGAGGQWAAGEGVADGAHGFRVVKISVVSDVMFCFRSQNSDASLYLKHWYSFYIRVEYQRLHENNLAQRAQLMVSCHLFLGRLRDGVPSLLTRDHLRWASKSLPAAQPEVRSCSSFRPERISLNSLSPLPQSLRL